MERDFVPEEWELKEEQRSTIRQFRHDHHYFSFLEYWDDYQQKFGYIDNKSQGLLTAASISVAVYFFVIAEVSRLDIGEASFDNFDLIQIAIAAIGMILVVISCCLLLRVCFSTTADKKFHEMAAEIEKFENALMPSEGKKREAVLDWLFKEYRILISLPPEQFDRNRSAIKEHISRLSERSDDRKIFLNFSQIDKFLRNTLVQLRLRVETEVYTRHKAYWWSRTLLLWGISGILISTFLLISPAVGQVLGLIPYPVCTFLQ